MVAARPGAVPRVFYGPTVNDSFCRDHGSDPQHVEPVSGPFPDVPTQLPSALIAAVELAKGSDFVGLELAGEVPEHSDFVEWLAGELASFEKCLWINGRRFTPAPCQSSEDWQNAYVLKRLETLRLVHEPVSALPRVLAITVKAEKCFASCRFCPQHLDPDRTRASELSHETLNRILDGVPEDSRIWIRLGMDGEPLNFPGIVPIIRTIRARRPMVRIETATNGLLLNEDWYQKLARAGLDHLSISVNAPTRDDYAWFSGLDGFDRLAEALPQLPLWRQRGRAIPLVTVNLLNVRRWAKRLRPAIRWLDQCVDRVDLTHVQFVDDKELENLDPRREAVRSSVARCTFLNNVMTIDCEGRLNICCATEFSSDAAPELGNVHQHTIGQLWRSETYTQLRERNRQGRAVIPACQRCKVNCQTATRDALMKAAAVEFG